MDPSDQNRIILSDFYHSRKIFSKKWTSGHLVARKKIEGNPNFISAAACRLEPMKFNDDIESVIILLAYLLNNNSLPWMNCFVRSEDFDLKVVERRLSPDNYVKLKMSLPAEIRDLWTNITSYLSSMEGAAVS